MDSGSSKSYSSVSEGSSNGDPSTSGDPGGGGSSGSSSGPAAYAWEIQNIDTSEGWYASFIVANVGGVNVEIISISSASGNIIDPPYGVTLGPGQSLQVFVDLPPEAPPGSTILGDEITVTSDGDTITFVLE